MSFGSIRNNYEPIHMVMSDDDDEKLLSCEITSQQLNLHDRPVNECGMMGGRPRNQRRCRATVAAAATSEAVESSTENPTLSGAKTRKEADGGVQGGGERGRWRRAKVASEEEEAEPVLVGALSLIPGPKLWLMIRCQATMADNGLTPTD